MVDDYKEAIFVWIPQGSCTYESTAFMTARTKLVQIQARQKLIIDWGGGQEGQATVIIFFKDREMSPGSSMYPQVRKYWGKKNKRKEKIKKVKVMNN